MSEPTNADRASWAFEAVCCFGQATAGVGWKTNLGMETAISDLLADLMHLADKHKLKFNVILEHGRMHYDAEIEEEDLTVRAELKKRNTPHGNQKHLR